MQTGIQDTSVSHELVLDVLKDYSVVINEKVFMQLLIDFYLCDKVYLIDI